jgi:hypothetical protein
MATFFRTWAMLPKWSIALFAYFAAHGGNIIEALEIKGASACQSNIAAIRPAFPGRGRHEIDLRVTEKT